SQYLTTEKPAAPTFSAGTGIYHAGGDILICIDAGHQNHGMSDKEPNGPGSDIMKAKVTSGTYGVSTGIEEHVVNLKVALLLRDELLARGYSVIMTRETGDVELSNIGRATIANESGADCMVRIHCNSSEKSSTNGGLGICQTSSNEFCGDIYDECLELTNAVLEGHCAATGVKNTGIWETDTMTGTNWCEVPNTIIEMGYMSNAEEDELLCSSDFQKKAAQGIADGIDAYFGR
ncbi:MAG: N-acetylmuramoyl-L-alanine amidase, partial [Firmicutes bacterium]|nr:N-acetylmuramoyl-L-alanine amidase [Bacillota bacterium]